MKKEQDILFKMNKRALSGIVAAVIMIALVVAIAGVVWMVVTNLVTEQLEEAGSCLDVTGKISINGQYTCYDSATNETFISIGLADINVSEVVVAVSGAGTTKSYRITNDAQTITGLKNYDGSPNIVLPGENEGLTYISSEFTTRPDTIRVFPVVKGKQCDATDVLTSISSCFLLE